MAATERLDKLTGDMYRAWEKAMTQWWDSVLESPDTLSRLGDQLTAHSAMRAQYERGVDKGLEGLHLPTRSDVVRLARIASLLEDRICGMEDKLLAMEDRLAELHKETLRARVDAVEAQVQVDEKLAVLGALVDTLDRVEAKLDGASSAGGASASKRSTRSTSKKTEA